MYKAYDIFINNVYPVYMYIIIISIIKKQLKTFVNSEIQTSKCLDWYTNLLRMHNYLHSKQVLVSTTECS